jgi:TPP-dependent pyruvate/acetoin dehydrogenase alpha subunit
MHESGRWSTVETTAMMDLVRARVVAARDEALSWPEPPVAERFEDVYA